MAEQKVRIAFLGLRQILDTDFEIILPQAVMQIAGAEKKMKQV
jgi:hypothetical protein